MDMVDTTALHQSEYRRVIATYSNLVLSDLEPSY